MRTQPIPQRPPIVKGRRSTRIRNKKLWTPLPPQPMTACPAGTVVAMVSVYNSSRWLRRRLDNLTATDTYRRGSLIVYCANASSPDPQDAEIMSAYAGKHHFQCENIPSCTVYACWNHIIRHTNSEYLCNANTDDLVHPQCYDRLLAACGVGAQIAYCDWYSIPDTMVAWHEISGTTGNASDYRPPHNMSVGHFPLWRRSLHDKVGLFDPNMKALGDADFWYRLWLSGVQAFTFVNEPLAAYTYRNGANLWHRVPEEDRHREWLTIERRQPGKLEF